MTDIPEMTDGFEGRRNRPREHGPLDRASNASAD
jgi:hypothetical protein